MPRSLLVPRFPVNRLKQRSRSRSRDLRTSLRDGRTQRSNLVPFLQLLAEIVRGDFAALEEPFAENRPAESFLEQETGVPQSLIERFPTQDNREIISKNRDFRSFIRKTSAFRDP